MRSCEDYEDLISAFIDGALAPEDRQGLMDHMAACPRCQTYFDNQIAIQDALERVKAPEDLRPAVMDRVRQTPQDVPAGGRTVRLRSWRRWAAIAACCAVAALGVLGLQRQGVNQAADLAAPAGGAAGGEEQVAVSGALYRMNPEESEETEEEVKEEAVEEAPAPLMEEDSASDTPEEAAIAPAMQAAPGVAKNSADSAAAESGTQDAASLFAHLPERFVFSSGAGGWRTELRISSDGSFTGSYTNSSAGWEDHPAQLYYCNFSGQFSEPEQVSEFVWSAAVESLELEDAPGETAYVEAGNLDRKSVV